MRVIVCGSRHWKDRTRIADRLFDLPPGSTIVEGGSGNADSMAAQEGQKLGHFIEEYRYQPFITKGDHRGRGAVSGKTAPLVRNAYMASLGADLCIAFWDGRSSGTMHMMEQAAKNGIPIEVIHEDFPNRPSRDMLFQTGYDGFIA